MEIMRAMQPHENVVQLRYFRAQQDHADDDVRLLTLFMDYLPSNLHSIIEEHASGLPLGLVQLYARQLFSALAHLAAQNIVHRDVLPRNILVDPTRNVLKLADFGCAKAVKPDVPNVSNVGAFQYRAIELLFGATHYNCKAGRILRR
jgi:serine/threonine protein kinase